MPTIAETIEADNAERNTELSESSLRNHTYQLKQFRIWAGGAGGLDKSNAIALKYRATQLGFVIDDVLL
jgi:DNA topoisomerase IB